METQAVPARRAISGDLTEQNDLREMVSGMDHGSNESTLVIRGFTPYAQIPRWILRAGGSLSHGSVRLYGVIMTYADNDTKTAFPSREKLAQDMGTSVATVKRAIKELEDCGALIVERRRNERTGNFYSNHYTLVFQEPWVTSDPPPSVMGDPVTTPKAPTPTPSTPDESGPLLHPRSDDRGRAQAADPISPDFYVSDERKVLITSVQTIAEDNARAGGNRLDRVIRNADLVDAFANTLTATFGTDDMLDYLIWDRNWQPPKKCADRFEAAKWLNTFLHTWKNETGGLTWRAAA